MNTTAEIAKRLAEERERIQLTVDQAAVLSGVTPAQWRAIEAGLIRMPIQFVLGLEGLGFNHRFIGPDNGFAARST